MIQFLQHTMIFQLLSKSLPQILSETATLSARDGARGSASPCALAHAHVHACNHVWLEVYALYEVYDTMADMTLQMTPT